MFKKLASDTHLIFYFVFSVIRLLIDYLRAGNEQRHGMLSITDIVNDELLFYDQNGSLFFYAATVGEFKGISGFINEAIERWPERKLIIISGQQQYIELIRLSYPGAIVCKAPSIIQTYKLFKYLKPKIIFFAEGPCLLNCFPIRLDLAMPAVALWQRIPLVVINASKHEKCIQSKLDFVEDRLFSSIHKRSVSFWYAASEHFASLLVDSHIPPEQVKLVGDVKFDNVFLTKNTAPDGELKQVLDSFSSSDIINFVAGSVSAIDEQKAVIEGWQALRNIYPNSRLILAPRQIAQPRTMELLYSYLNENSIPYTKRSDGVVASSHSSLLIIDVFGELSYFYSIACICYIGRNHGLLEPLKYTKPVIVAPDNDWKSTYVTYQQYQQMVSSGAIVQLQDKSELGIRLIELVTNKSLRHAVTTQAEEFCNKERGAGQRILQHIEQNLIME